MRPMGASFVATHHAHTPSAVEGGRVISEMPVLGLTYGQAMQIKEDAYELGIDTVISVHGAEFHFFQKKNGMKCMTYHSQYMNFAIYDYVLTWVGPRKKKGNHAILIRPKDAHNNQKITLFIR